ncbi:hypothetical protein [Actinocatenispora sera]|uniref:GH26 domain-containing protein n=1 Tax=Actinocatenispora sera TaxID=390989 RepID=A0A810KTI1_9ACTN|nr:hypothetical protein [Actinocatenispora sera]BCJ26284.1 hypothetical protein Asera_03920 [Actinocatenispora sera]
MRNRIQLAMAAVVAITAALAATVPAGATATVPAGATAGVTAGDTRTFHDSFDGAHDADPGYGLNDGLAGRQGTGGVTYTRVSGLWNTGTAPRPWYSQVNHPEHADTLSFFQGTSAVRMDAPVVATDDATSVAATLTPVVGSTTSGAWSSIVLSHDARSWGYVSNADVDLSVLVRSDGSVQVHQAGTLVRNLPDFASGGTYRVRLSVTGQTLHLSVDDATTTVPLPAAVPDRTWLFLGRYGSNETDVSTVDDLAAGAVDSTALRRPAGSHLRYTGYFAARQTRDGGNHLDEVAGRSNLDFVTISDADKYRPEELQRCAPKSCVVYTGNEFFQCSSTACPLYPNAADRWATLAEQVRPYLDRIAAFSVLDEPYWRHASYDDVATSANLVKKTYPDIPVLLNEAGPAVTDTFRVPDQVDWVAFDWYCQSPTRIDATLDTLERQVPDRAGRELFLFAEATPICAGQTDQSVAAGLDQYRRIAEAHPRVAGLLLFGPWTGVGPDSPGPGKPTPSQYPLSTDAQERLAARILGDTN